MKTLARLRSAAFGIVAIFASTGAVFASCYPLAGLEPRLIPASYQQLANGVPAHHARISFVGHSTFEVESPDGVRVATDYNDYIRPERLPHIVTMNNAHETHFATFIEEGIPHVLRGWDPKGGIARHNVKLKDVRVRNIPTNLSPIGENKWTNNNSMFVIEVVGLCIVHISHLHHVLSKDQMRDLGRVDIAFAPIDGMWTMSHEELFEVLDQIKPVMIIPMHFGSMGGMQAFIAKAGEKWPIKQHTGRSIELTFRDLPRKTEVLFLQGY